MECDFAQNNFLNLCMFVHTYLLSYAIIIDVTPQYII